MSIIISLLAFVVSMFKPSVDDESTHGELSSESCPECNAPATKMHATKCPRHPDNYDAHINKEKEDMNNTPKCQVLKRKGGQCTIDGEYVVNTDGSADHLVCHLHHNLIMNKDFDARFVGAWIEEPGKEEEVKMGPIAQAWVTGDAPKMEAEEWILPPEARSDFVPAEQLERMLVTFIRRSPANPNVFRKVGQIKKSAVPNTTEVLRMLKIENLRSARTRIAGFYFLNENSNTPTHVLVKCESRSWAFAISFVDGKVFLSKVTKEFKAMKKEGRLVIN